MSSRTNAQQAARSAARARAMADLQERVSLLEAVLKNAWRWSTDAMTRPRLDVLDVEELRALLRVADDDFELREALDRLVRNQ